MTSGASEHAAGGGRRSLRERYVFPVERVRRPGGGTARRAALLPRGAGRTAAARGWADGREAVRFRATVELNGKTATGFEVPGDVLERLGPGKRPAVRVTLGGHTYASTVGSMGGRAMLPLSAENRAAAGVSAGDEVEVELAPDLAPRTVEVPATWRRRSPRTPPRRRRTTGCHPASARSGSAGSRRPSARRPARTASRKPSKRSQPGGGHGDADRGVFVLGAAQDQARRLA